MVSSIDKVSFNSNFFRNIETRNYQHVSLPESVDGDTFRLLGDASLNNYANMNAVGLNGITEPGILDGALNFQPTSSIKHKLFQEEHGFYPSAEKGWVA